jgi:tRNA threonylcarbamoyladenosine biosynthesis protein TsaE
VALGNTCQVTISVGSKRIFVTGNAGAGKTTFTKGFAGGLNIDEDVQSPSFTISRVYQANSGLRLVHYDFYRLHDAGILTGELAENQIDSKTVTIIEWADIVEDVLPQDRLQIKILATGENSRLVEITALGAKSRKLLEVLA